MSDHIGKGAGPRVSAEESLEGGEIRREGCRRAMEGST